jgi:hypothetical protein
LNRAEIPGPVGELQAYSDCLLKRSAALPDDMAMVTHVMAYRMMMTPHHRTIAVVVSGGNGCYSAQSAHCKSDGKENFFHRTPWKIDVRCERLSNGPWEPNTF